MDEKNKMVQSLTSCCVYLRTYGASTLANGGFGFCLFAVNHKFMLQRHVVEVVEVVQKAKTLWQIKDGDQWWNKGKSMEAARQNSTTGNATRRQKVRRWKDCCFALREHRWDGGISCVFLWESGHLARHPQVPASVAINYPPQMLLSGGRRDCGEAPLRWFWKRSLQTQITTSECS